MNQLFQSYRFKCGLESKNRIALAPMTNKQSPTGALSAEELRWLKLRVEGGFGIIITAAASVIQSGRAWNGQLAVESDDHEVALKPLAKICRDNKALSIVQLHHGGVASPRTICGYQPISASTAFVEGYHAEAPRAATPQDITNIVQAFEKSAERVAKAGLDGIEIHGANGYLITQFLSTFFNTRTDEWGGSKEKRANLLFEIVKKSRIALGPKKILGVRLSPYSSVSHPGIDSADMLWTAQQLCAMGVDYIHLSQGNALEIPEGMNQTLAALYRKSLSSEVSVMVAGGIVERSTAVRCLEAGADFVALAKGAMSNPDWPNRMCADAHYQPAKFPMSVAELYERGLSPAFTNYLKEFKRAHLIRE